MLRIKKWHVTFISISIFFCFLFALAVSSHSAWAESQNSKRKSPGHLQHKIVKIGENKVIVIVPKQITIHKEYPEEVQVPFAVFNLSGKGKVKLRKITINKNTKPTLIPVDISLEPISRGKRADEQEILEALELDDADQMKSYINNGYVKRIPVDVKELHLTDGESTTITVNTLLESSDINFEITMQTPVTVASMSTEVYWYGGDGHVHTKEVVPHDSITGRANYARNNGLRWLIITDHSDVITRGILGYGGWLPYVQECDSVQKNIWNIWGNTYPSFAIAPGFEVTSVDTRGNATGDLLGYALDEVKTSIPENKQFSGQSLISQINTHFSPFSYSIIAHPYHSQESLNWDDWGATGFRAIELLSNEKLAQEDPGRTIDRWFSLLRDGLTDTLSGGRFVVGLGGTDAHFQGPGDNGMSWAYMPDYNDYGMEGNWILVANPSKTDYANGFIIIGGKTMGSFSIPPGSRITPKYPEIMDGPVNVISDKPIISSQRVLYKSSFNEITGFEFASKIHYFPWYDCLYMKTWILVGNPQSSTVNVTIKIAGVIKANTTIPAGSRKYFIYSGLIDGPVVVTSDQSVYATQRSLFPYPTPTSFCEFKGIPDWSLKTVNYFPWYDCQYMKTWILLGNPSSTSPVHADIYIAGNFKEGVDLPAGGRYYAYYNKQMGGPVKIYSSAPIYTTQRSLFSYANPTSFTEVAGLNVFDTTHYFPWYDCVYMKTWILIGNPNNTAVSATIYIGSENKGTVNIPANGNVDRIFDGTMGGPVRIEASNVVYATQRSLFPKYLNSSFCEVPGIRNITLQSSNYYPWYDDTTERTPLWSAIREGRVSASGTKDFGRFTINWVNQGGVLRVKPGDKLTFRIASQPVSGRKCYYISVISVRNYPPYNRYTARAFPLSEVAANNTWEITAATDTFYVVKFVFSSDPRNSAEDSHVWTNPIFIDVEGVGFTSQASNVVLVVDSTGSMDDNKEQAKDTAKHVAKALEGSDHRVAIVDYKDHTGSAGSDPGDYPYRVVLPFTSDTSAILAAIEGGIAWQRADEGLASPIIWDIAANKPTASAPATIYAATNNGVYKTETKGANWSEMNTGLIDLWVKSLLVTNPNPATLLAGTWRQGVFSYLDIFGGSSWIPHGPNMGIFGLAKNPQNPSVVYAAGETGVFKSTDGGDAWNATSLADKYIYDVAVDPENPANIYAAAKSWGVYKSEDSGDTWTLTSLADPFVYSLAVDPVNPNTIYAGAFEHLYKSTDGGATWQSIFDLPGKYVYTVALDPNNHSVVYAGTSAGVYRLEKPEHWTLLGLSDLEVYAISFDPDDTSGLYTIASNPKTASTIYAGTYGGSLYKGAETGLHSSGGGDERESVYAALMHALDLSSLGGWRQIQNKLIILIGDAAPHDPEPFTGYTLDQVVAAAEAVDPATIFSLALGGDSTTYDYFSRLAEQTDGEMFTEETAELLPDAILAKINETTAPAILEATLDIDPDTLNLESNGRWITAYIELPSGYDVSRIVIPSLRLNGIISAELSPTEIGDYDADGIPDLMVKFDRASLQDLLSPGDQLLIVTGNLEDQIFIGEDTIRAIMPAREKDPNHPK